MVVEPSVVQPRRSSGRGVLSSGLAIPVDQVPESLIGSRLIVLAGPVESGKTTLVSSIYEAFHFGQFGSFAFAGSETLMAFERRCHDGRIQSDLDQAKTRRTSRAELGDLLHMSVRPLNPPHSARIQVLINDVTGERFENLVARPLDASKMPVLARASRVVVVLDGDRLRDPTSRDGTAYDAEVLARGINDYGGLQNSARIDVVVTKMDLVHLDGPDSEAFATKSAQRVLERVSLSHRGAAFESCARSESPKDTATRLGVLEVMSAWLEP